MYIHPCIYMYMHVHVSDIHVHLYVHVHVQHYIESKAHPVDCSVNE